MLCKSLKLRLGSRNHRQPTWRLVSVAKSPAQPILPAPFHRSGCSRASLECSSSTAEAQHASLGDVMQEDVESDRSEHEGEFEMLESTSTSGASLDLPLPEVSCQSPLHIKDRKALRSRAESMAKDKSLMRVQIGQNGITQTFLSSCMDILMKHDLLRVKMGEGCGLERTETARTLERYLDAVCVHQIGYTVTFYREKGLPRPSNTFLPQVSSSEVVVEAPVVPAVVETKSKLNSRLAAERSAKEKKPPQFQVL